MVAGDGIKKKNQSKHKKWPRKIEKIEIGSLSHPQINKPGVILCDIRRGLYYVCLAMFTGSEVLRL